MYWSRLPSLHLSAMFPKPWANVISLFGERSPAIALKILSRGTDMFPQCLALSEFQGSVAAQRKEKIQNLFVNNMWAATFGSIGT